MIVYPQNWMDAGQEPTIDDLSHALWRVLEGIECCDLSYSGGMDSSLILWHMLHSDRKVCAFTMGLGEDHPDIQYAKLGVKWCEAKFGVEIEHKIFVIEGESGDPAVAKYYREVAKYTDAIITGDGIDEYMAGYYSHQEEPVEEVYIAHLRRLLDDHLIPLNENSGNVAVYVPYLAEELVSLMTKIPLSDKVDAHNRKKIMVAMSEGKMPQEIIERRKYGLATRARVLAGAE